MKELFSRCLAAGMAAGLSFGAFAEDAYVEANGTQCVAVDCQPTEKTRYEVDFQFVEAQKNATILGWEDTGVKLGLWSNGNGNIEAPYGNNPDNGDWSHGLIKYDTVRHTAIIDRKANEYKMLTDGKVVGNVRKPDRIGMVTGENRRPLSLFGLLGDDFMSTNSNRSKLRIFRLKVFDDDVLTHEYVPCRKGTEIGFYDLKTESFFGRICGDALTCGGDILTIEDDPYVSSPDGLVTVMTGYTVTSNTCLEIDFSIETTMRQQFLYEAGPSDKPFGRLYVASSRTFRWSFDDSSKAIEAFGTTDPTLANVVGVRRKAKLDSYNGRVMFSTYDLVNADYEMTLPRSKTSGSYPLRLFSASSGEKVNTTDTGGFATMKLYGFKIYEEGVLQHDYEPMSWKGIGVLRDRVTGRVLCANKNTTAVNDLSFGGKIRELPYIQSTGNQQIVLDYKPNAKTYLEVGVFDLGSAKRSMLFGSMETNGICFWSNDKANLEMNAHGVWPGRLQTGAVDSYLHAFVADIPNDKLYNYIGGWASPNQYSPIDMSTKAGYVHDTPECVSPLAVFNTNPLPADWQDPAFSNFYNCAGAAFCLTHVTVKEDGEVIHLYEPYVKDGLVGLKDAKTGNFFTGLNRGNDTALLYGGDIAYEGSSDAYVESDGTQFVPTDYLFNEKSRVEIDFQFMSPALRVALAGAWNEGPSWVGFYRTKTGNFEFVTPNADNGERVHTSSGVKADLGRYQGVIDAPAGISQFLDGTTVKKQKSVASFTGTASLPFGLFGNAAADGGSTEHSCARIFSLRIKEKEGGVYVLKREYLPYKSGETVGFRDSVTGAIIVNTAPDANPLKVGGMGVEGSGSFFKVEPEDATVDVGGSATLRAYAPGAVKYRWTKDGAVLAETITDTLAVDWTNKPRESVYGVTPIYSIFGHEVEGEGVTATLENVPSGMVILLK